MHRLWVKREGSTVFTNILAQLALKGLKFRLYKVVTNSLKNQDCVVGAATACTMCRLGSSGSQYGIHSLAEDLISSQRFEPCSKLLKEMTTSCNTMSQ